MDFEDTIFENTYQGLRGDQSRNKTEVKRRGGLFKKTIDRSVLNSTENKYI